MISLAPDPGPRDSAQSAAPPMYIGARAITSLAAKRGVASWPSAI